MSCWFDIDLRSALLLPTQHWYVHPLDVLAAIRSHSALDQAALEAFLSCSSLFLHAAQAGSQ
jgi:hypothetical protein